ncbi:MAG TPA: hypothetical protein VII17_04755 [Steroidobacteraceae bacterium]
MRELIGFDGAVECRLESGPINLTLRGFERRGARAESRVVAESLFGAAATTSALDALPSRLHDVQIFELDDKAGVRRFEIRAKELRLTLESRSLQLHRYAGRAFFSAVPPPRVLWRRRLGWALLLWALRLPGAEGLLARLRPAR